MKYYVIETNDRETSVTEMDRELLMDFIQPEEWCDEEHRIFMTHIDNTITKYWKINGVLIIKGEIVTPIPTKIVMDID